MIIQMIDPFFFVSSGIFSENETKKLSAGCKELYSYRYICHYLSFLMICKITQTAHHTPSLDSIHCIC